MRKTISVILVMLCIFCLFSVNIYAEGEKIGRYSSYTTVYFQTDRYGSLGSTHKNMIRNPYYQKYYNELMNYSYQVYVKFRDKTQDNKKYIELYSEQYLKEAENYATLIFYAPDIAPDNTTEYNRSILEKYFKEEDILYVSDYDYAAVVCIADTDSDVVTKMPELEFIGAAFFTNDPMYLQPMTGTYAVGDVFFGEGDYRYDDRINASDARFLLRYTAGLEEVGAKKQFYFCADMNFDNRIDAADARLALRTAAGLEKLFYLCYAYDQFWYDNMGVLNNEK